MTPSSVIAGAKRRGDPSAVTSGVPPPAGLLRNPRPLTTDGTDITDDHIGSGLSFRPIVSPERTHFPIFRFPAFTLLRFSNFPTQRTPVATGGRVLKYIQSAFNSVSSSWANARGITALISLPSGRFEVRMA